VNYVLDSYAFLARYWLEPGAARVEALLRNRRARLWASVVNYGEVFYRIALEETVLSAEQVMAWLEVLPVHRVDANWEMTKNAAFLKASYRISYADAFATALAQQLDAAVVTGDKEFEGPERDGVVRVEWLPAKPRRRR
jgi:PIN domain nuclease of toxin-antitoxin system